ncbi:FKBP-type peptidyl-prolyl cis-trans isomerase [Mariniflexile gromovii]|uniref:peptidylprolyl isomerase n=1 Tax=Mariniflexile gromovii TaxID=362523 RepID=A0ABS4BTQ0_9FLAO|nr:peptidylprolyl isomerase [Mariniflexile gromovii]MBP0903962.1 peptidylprolyl isomerase [Mariniflexile gromovii]
MNLRKVSLYLICLTIGVLACKKDDEPDPVLIEIRDRTVQQEEDIISLNTYLNTHYYNSEEIESLGTNVSISDIVITKLLENQTAADIPVGHTLLKNGDVLAPKLEKKSVKYADTDYEYYVLRLNQGGGSKSPKFADDIRVNYEGFTLDDAVFDYSVNPTDFDLITEVVLEGWRHVFPEFNTAESFVENGDGTVSFLNKGLGIMFLPSGLAYFSSATTAIPAYSPLIFKFELLQTSENDHDGDGIPSYLEDLNGDGQFNINYEDLSDTTDDDTDGDGNPDFLDTDDDGDGISTINEDINKDGDPTNDDSNGNGIPNYLDKTDIIKKS